MIHETASTGTCIALIKGESRSLVAHLGAAETYAINAISKEYLNILNTVKIIYIEGFFLTKRFDVARYVREITVSHNSIFAFNISGVYLCTWHPKEILEFAEFCDILFGNINEFSALGQILKIDNPKEVAIMLSKNKERDNSNPLLRHGKIVVMTNGSKDVSCVYNEGEIIEFAVPKLCGTAIVDTTGAGDSFVAGFLAALLQQYSIEKCLHIGCWAARQIIQELGCTVPNFPCDIKTVL